jgi:hypothetical protein
MKRQIYIDGTVNTIVRSKFIDGEEWVLTTTQEHGLSLGWIKLSDVLDNAK